MALGMIRARLMRWLARWYLARSRKNSSGQSMLSLLPDASLVPLKRIGLDPISALGDRRKTEPVSVLPLPWGLRGWLITGYAEVKEVLGRVEGLSNDFTNLVDAGGTNAQQNPGGLGFADPPTHTRLRRLLTPEFTMRRLNRLAPRIDMIVTQALDNMQQAEKPVDLWQSFALPIPSLTICELLGVPYADRAEFQRLSTARFDLFEGAGASLGAISESLSYLRGIVAQQRQSPGEGLLGMIIKEHGDEIDDEELAGLADGVLTGGLETTASMLALGAIVLLRSDECRQLALGDEQSVHKLVEELLRYLTVVQVAFPRFAIQDLDIGGKHIAKGDIVLCSLSAANRDPALANAVGLGDIDLEQPDLSRPAMSHVAFGYGMHRCVGAELARMELRAAYPALLRRFPDIRLAVESDELSYRKLSIVYGVDTLPVLLK